LETRKTYETILVATDGSDPAKHAVECAANSAQKWGAKLLLLTVVPPPCTIFTDVAGFSTDYNLDYEKTIMAYHVGVLDNAKKYLKEKYPDLNVSTKIKKGYVSKKILEAAEEGKADLIVIGSRGLGGLTSMFLGSVSNYVVNHCKLPILVVKKDGGEM
jgi:nucleotide-binding universal stress UspA family protein